MAAFTTAKYELDSGDVASVRIHAATAAAVIGGTTNAEAAADVNLPTLAKVGGSGRSYGVHCRVIYAEYTGALPSGITNKRITIPWLVRSTWAAIQPGDTGTYNSVAVKYVGKRAEKVK